MSIKRPQFEPPRDRYIYYPDASPVPQDVAADLRGRSYKIVANVDIGNDAQGVLFAVGDRFGGHALFIKDGKLHYIYNFLGLTPEQDFVSGPLTPGKHSLGMEFTRESAGKYGESLGTTTLYVDDQAVTKGPMRAQVGVFGAGAGMCVGYDTGDAVSPQYPYPGIFTGGTIQGVAIDVSKEAYPDLQGEAAAALARE
jgi:hypothetical protein